MSAITFTGAEITAYYEARVPRLKQSGREWRGPCPIHEGKRDSFAVDADTGLWHCHSACGRGGDILALEQALTASDFKSAKAEAFRLVGRDETAVSNAARSQSARGRIVATYDYTDESGQLLYQVVRMEPKDFRQRKPDGKNGWVWNTKDVRLVLYRLSEILKRNTETIFIVEGEKDVESAENIGLLATCNAMGAGKWRPEYSESIRGRSVVIIPDNDPADENAANSHKGQRHAAAVAESLLDAGCEVRIVEVPQCKDVSDWLGGGGTLQQLRELYAGAHPLTADSLMAWSARWQPKAPQKNEAILVEAIQDDPRKAEAIKFPAIIWGGLAERYRDLIDPCTEAAPEYLLACFMTAVGSLV